MKEIQTTNLLYTDDENQRLLMSEEFNFALDKNTGVSVCWGKTIEDTPVYDPVSPQELVFKINNEFSLKTYLKQFNFLGNIKIKKSKTEFKNIENEIEALTLDNLTCLSTLANVVLIFDSLKNFDINELLKFTRYIRKFKVQLVIQINADHELTYEEAVQLKLLGTSVQLKTSEKFSAENFINNLNILESNNILVSSKISVTKKNYDQVLNVIPLLPKDVSIKLYFVEPFITTIKYKTIQQKFIDENLLNVKITTYLSEHFNKRKNNILLTPIDCDGACFSVYIEDGLIYPDEYLKVIGIPIDECKCIHDFWYHHNFKNIREKIANHNLCK